MGITLSSATNSDVDDIADLLRASWAAAYGSFLTTNELDTAAHEWHAPNVLSKQISRPGVAFLLARSDAGRLVGVATAKQSSDELAVNILRLYVLPEHQGQGIGSQLLDAVLARFPNARRIQLHVAEGNAEGLSFWTTRGFRACGRDEARLGASTLALIAMERAVVD